MSNKLSDYGINQGSGPAAGPPVGGFHMMPVTTYYGSSIEKLLPNTKYDFPVGTKNLFNFNFSKSKILKRKSKKNKRSKKKSKKHKRSKKL